MQAYVFCFVVEAEEKKAQHHVHTPDMPIPLLLRALQPQARLIISLADPVRRMYSDYFFLTSNSVAFDTDGKSPVLFHDIATDQVTPPPLPCIFLQ